MNGESNLVFFDTFSHESSELQLDLVQFQLPVHVSQIRVIPLGARVQANFPGGVRLGATNPGQFEIEFFVNDLSKRGAATFESIGCMQYSQHGDIKMDLGKKLPTDGLLLRGSYNTITLAVYGKLAKVYQDSPPKSQSEVPQPPPEKVNTHERIRDWLEDTKVPRSPDRPWDESVEGKVEKERRKEKQKSTPREIEKLRASNERSSHSREKSWDLSEKSSYRKSKKDSLNKDMDRELSKDREMSMKIKDSNSSDKERTRDISDKEWDSDLARGKDADYEKEHSSSRDIYEDEFNFPKKRQIIDEWEHRSETSSHSMRRPRTPQELERALSDPRVVRSPYLCTDEIPRKEWDDKDWDRESRDKEKPWDRSKDSYRNWSRSRSRDKDRGRSPPKSPEQSLIPPPILSDEMEAISDDEELLNLPVESADGDYPPDENMEGSINDENEAFEYEDIMSDEEELSGYQYEDDYVVEEWEDYIKPLATQEMLEVHHLRYFQPPHITDYEAQLWSRDPTDKEKLDSEPCAVAAKLTILVKDTPIPTRLCHEISDPDAAGGMSAIEAEESWVHAVEYASQLLPSALVGVDDKQDILHILYSWVGNCLNFDMAMNHHQPLYKIRHIKAGVKLSISMLQCNGSIVTDLLKQGLFDKLIDLFHKDSMAVAIKLLILRAIDVIALSVEGIRFITDESFCKSGYERILQLLSSPQQSRVKVSISAIVRKIHFLEVCDKFHDDVAKLAILLQTKYVHIEDPDCNNMQETYKLDDQSLPHLASVESCLKEIVHWYLFADHLMTQSVRWLPGSKQFQLPKSDYDPYSHIYGMMNETKIMESISVLLASSQLMNSAPILMLIKTLLERMLQVEHGIIYLAWKGAISSAIIKALLQFEKDDRYYGPDSLFQQLGWKLAYSIHIVAQFDNLAQIANCSSTKKAKPLCESICSQACSPLNALQSILLSSVGKEILVHTLMLPKFTRIIFPYLNIDPSCDLEDQPATAACYGYVVELLVTSVKLNPNGRFLESCSGRLAELIGCKETNIKVEDYTKLRTLLPYLNVGKVENFSYDNFGALINTVQEGIEQLEQFPGELFSALQILCHLTIPGRCLSTIDAEYCKDELVKELRYAYATVKLFSGDLHTHLIHLLSKLCAMYGQTFLHTSGFSTAEGQMVLLLILPAVTLLRNLLSSVIEAGNTDFKDLTAIAPLLQTYLLLDVYPVSSAYYAGAQSTQAVIVSIILLYTQPVYTTEGEEVLAKSLWTLMMAEIFKMLLSSPRNVVAMLKLIIKLLPLPLPIQSYSPLSDEETLQAVRLRKLWSAHLYILSGTLHDIIIRLGVGSHPALRHSLRKMCVAVADLSAPMALLVARSTLDLVMQSHRMDQKATPKDGLQVMSAQTCRVLGTLGSLLSHAPIKTAVVHLLRGGGPSLAVAKCKAEEKYPSLVGIWCNVLTVPSNQQIHMAAQGALLVVIYNLINRETTMGQETESDRNLVMSGVPPKDLLIPLVEAVIDSLRTCLSIHCARMALSALSLLLDHNYGFYYVKCILDKKKGCLYPVLNMLCSEMARNFEDSFYLFQTYITFCDDLLFPDCHRSYTVTPSELATYLGWKDSLEGILPFSEGVVREGCDTILDEEGKHELDLCRLEQVLLKMEDIHLKNAHPLLQLEKLVVENGLEDEISEFLNEDIKYIISRMESYESPISESPNLECLDHTIEPLQTQFASRVTWVIPNGDEDQSTWFLPPLIDNIDQSEMVKVSLLEVCRKYTEDYDLSGALHKISKGLSLQSLSPQKISKAVTKYKPSSSAIRPDRRSKPYVAPMRGRNFGRGNIRSDPFRSRPPNTSRPPSLHVDDFVALESTGHQPTGPTGYNKISFGRGKMMLDSMRGRGRQRGMNDSRGNRFVHRIPFRGMRQRPQGWGYRGDGSRGNYRGSGGGHFLRGRLPSGSYRSRAIMSNNSKERFSMKYIDRGRRKYA